MVDFGEPTKQTTVWRSNNRFGLQRTMPRTSLASRRRTDNDRISLDRIRFHHFLHGFFDRRVPRMLKTERHGFSAVSVNGIQQQRSAKQHSPQKQDTIYESF